MENNQRSEQLLASIGSQVMRTLGEPGDLQRVQVRPLWDDRYRVNVYVGADLISARIVHSYFLSVDDAGNIVASTPGITKQY